MTSQSLRKAIHCSWWAPFTVSEDLAGLPSAWRHTNFPRCPLFKAPILNSHPFSLGAGPAVSPLAQLCKPSDASTESRERSQESSASDGLKNLWVTVGALPTSTLSGLYEVEGGPVGKALTPSNASPLHLVHTKPQTRLLEGLPLLLLLPCGN